MLSPTTTLILALVVLIAGAIAGYVVRDKRLLGEVAEEVREEARDAAQTARRVEKSVAGRVDRIESKVDGIRDDLSELIRTAAETVDAEEKDNGGDPTGRLN
ncbi:hypothetical protein [Salinibacter phage M31CR41-2]|uniref:Uncharacterized protein n=1 Tax=Salinibacter phage M31CR41-2 TaxID=2681614 RepID=A0A2I6UH78_9CAUD|nr:hypothetical protein FGG68_gp12 [Salinibacter phage M31CR41-2]AUO79312.1 hypothetical protein [Salinibacter phage M31CR41-2]